MSRHRSKPVQRKPAGAPGYKRAALLIAVCASAGLSLLAVLWAQRGTERPAGRRVDPQHLPAQISEAREAAEQFINCWSTFRYEDALSVSTGETQRRVELAIRKEAAMSPAEREIASSLRQSVSELRVRLDVTEVVEDTATRKVLRGIAVAQASDQEFRRDQEFELTMEEGKWKVSSWDPGQPGSSGLAGAAEPGLQLLPEDDPPEGRAP